MLSFRAVCGSARIPESAATNGQPTNRPTDQPTKRRYARVDKVARARAPDYTITSCRETKSAPAPSTVNTQAFARSPRISESFGKTPSDYVFDIFAASASPSYQATCFSLPSLFYSALNLIPATGTARPRTFQRNLQRNRIACKDNLTLLVRLCVIYYVLQ